MPSERREPNSIDHSTWPSNADIGSQLGSIAFEPAFSDNRIEHDIDLGNSQSLLTASHEPSGPWPSFVATIHEPSFSGDGHEFQRSRALDYEELPMNAVAWNESCFSSLGVSEFTQAL
ncbi:hypothetical protein FKW77_005087 [Venturia effusa]|uniref:Uncharacterized protein n=1 Tax=Venturia effusa TaxID=50376 RepID=A0A517LIS2_9PEZI|nr:hypothetical protein FKW77_005087 [Venturia effusa]